MKEYELEKEIKMLKEIIIDLEVKNKEKEEKLNDKDDLISYLRKHIEELEKKGDGKND